MTKDILWHPIKFHNKILLTTEVGAKSVLSNVVYTVAILSADHNDGKEKCDMKFEDNVTAKNVSYSAFYFYEKD